jgi:two-component system chemotaxis response regulator CheB
MFMEDTANFGAGESRSNAGNPQGGPRPAVLIVEDEHISRRALKTLLASYGFSIEAAESAEQALQLLDELKQRPGPHIALVDLNLPGMNGLEFISRMVTLDPAAVPVLMTATGEDALAAALRGHAVPYLRKPLDFDRLLSVIEEKSRN